MIILRTKPNRVCHDIPFDWKVIGSVYCDSWSKALVEGAVSDIGRLDVVDSSSIRKGQGAASISTLHPSLLTSGAELHIRETCIP